MRKIIAILTLCNATALFSEGNLQTFEVDKQHTSVSFDIGHLGISKVRGSMLVDSGTIKGDPKDLTKTSLEIKISVNSLNTNVTMRDKHVLSEEFLAAEKFPFITFKSTAVKEDKAKGKLFIDGDLTIKGKTKKITLEASPISEEVRIPKDGKIKIVRATSASTTINRYDFGIDYGKVADKQDPMSKLLDGGVGREISITILAEFFRIENGESSPQAKK
jgi:polyisoprenoid-binding protein YceI